MRTLRIVLSLALVLVCRFAMADQIVLNNGDQISGTIVKSDTKDLVIKTDYAGEVTVQLFAIKSIGSIANDPAIAPPSTTSESNAVAAAMPPVTICWPA